MHIHSVEDYPCITSSNSGYVKALGKGYCVDLPLFERLSQMLSTEYKEYKVSGSDAVHSCLTSRDSGLVSLSGSDFCLPRDAFCATIDRLGENHPMCQINLHEDHLLGKGWSSTAVPQDSEPMAAIGGVTF